MQTLQQYLTEIKASEYLLALAFLALFVVFWRFVNGGRK